MFNFQYPFAVRLLGFDPAEKVIFEQIFTRSNKNPYRFFCLQEDNILDPDIFLVNGDKEKVLLALAYLGPSALRPALLITNESKTVHPRIARLINPGQLIFALNKLVEERADALAALEASDIVTVPERRRRERLFDETLSREDYIRMRRPQVNGGIVIVDKHINSRDRIAEMLIHRPVCVLYADTEANAFDACRQQKISIVFINMSMQEVDAYRLCAMIKRQIADRITIIFLVRSASEYDQERARCSGCDGFLEKPLSSKNLLSAIKKFHPAFWH